MPNLHRTPSRRQLLAIVAVLLGVVTLAIGIYGLIAGPTGHGSATPAPPSTGVGGAGREVDLDRLPRTQSSSNRPASLRSAGDPETFTGLVAQALFDWNTVGSTPLSEYAGRVLAVADPTGFESAGLMTDIAMYLPTLAAWHQLQPYATRQWIQIESIDTPASWAPALEAAGPGGFAPGTTARTVHGQRHRAGVWEGNSVGSTHEVAFTVFMVCQPTYPSCRLLRLSRLNEPLD